MATHTWDHSRSKERIDKEIDAVSEIEIVDYKKDLSLANIPKTKAYKMDSVHMYADILNLSDILETTDTEGETCHKRTLRFLNLHYRAVHRILDRCDAMRVDFHNQRLHSVVAKPYNSEKDAEAKRIHRAVSIGQLIIDVLKETGDDDENIPNAEVCIGIDTGKSLAVNNGRRGGREPLFLGEPANHAAKHSASKVAGIYLTNGARKAIGLAEVKDSKKTALTASEVKACQDEAALGVSKEAIVKEWRQDNKDHPIGKFQFSGHTPPMRTLNIESLTPSNSRRQEQVSLYADIDGFTAYVGANIDSNPQDVVRTLHVIRTELDCALSADFEGRRVRFIGDCIHGIMCEGTAQTTEDQDSISDATRCAGALRSSFNLAMERLQASKIDTGVLGLAIGFDFGPTATSRLGMQGDRVRCCVSRAVLQSEREQARCAGNQTAIGQNAYKKASDAVKNAFSDGRVADDFDYTEATEQLAESGERTASAAKAVAYETASLGVVQYLSQPSRPHSTR